MPSPTAAISFVTPIPLPSEPAPDTAIQLYPVVVATAMPAATGASPPETLYGVPVRVSHYVGDFVASSAVEAADGELYVTYFWDLGSTPYQADRLGVLDGGAIREIFAGAFLDELTSVGESRGYPRFIVDAGDTAHMSDNYGLWQVSGAGVKMIERAQPGYYSPPPRPCSWCYPHQQTRAPRYCAPFAGGTLCDSGEGVTFIKNGVTRVVDKSGYLVGAGPHRFLIIERPFAEPPIYLEGFAASD